MKRRALFWRVALLFLPASVFGVFVVWPLLNTFYYSFTDWNGFNPAVRFVGLRNFAGVVTDRLFTNATVNTLIWTLLAIVVPTLGGLTLALMLDVRVPGAGVFKSIFYLPICLAAVVVGQIWIWIYQPDWGLLNAAVGVFTGRPPVFAWLAEPHTALYSVIAAWSWQQMGLAMVIFLAGLTSIPPPLLEAAEIEGASRGQRIRHVVLALLRPATVVAVALSVINSLKAFDILAIMTGGGPFHSSDTLAMFMYSESFKKYRMGYGSSIAVVLFLMTLAVIAVYFRQLKKLDELYD